MHEPLVLDELKQHVQSQIDACSQFLLTTKALSEMLQASAPDMEALAQNNLQSIQQAESLQELHLRRQEMVKALGADSIDVLAEQDGELDHLVSEFRSRLEQVKALNEENAIVVAALFSEAEKKMGALQAAARQSGTYDPSGHKASTSSRPLACA